jgi:hypothetical protein
MPLIDIVAVEAIEEIIRNGNNAEVKIVNGNVVIVEIKRKLILQTPKTG